VRLWIKLVHLTFYVRREERSRGRMKGGGKMKGEESIGEEGGGERRVEVSLRKS
jgi:hypothetical protein